MADLDFLAKVCFVLDCEVSDLLEYQRPKMPLTSPVTILLWYGMCHFEAAIREWIAAFSILTLLYYIIVLL